MKKFTHEGAIRGKCWLATHSYPRKTQNNGRHCFLIHGLGSRFETSNAHENVVENEIEGIIYFIFESNVRERAINNEIRWIIRPVDRAYANRCRARVEESAFFPITCI